MWFSYVPLITAATYIGSCVLSLIGFTPAGVAPGTIAAIWQASIGNVASGSLFSLLQYAGATGVGSMIGGIFGAVTTAIGVFLFKN